MSDQYGSGNGGLDWYGVLYLNTINDDSMHHLQVHPLYPHPLRNHHSE